MSIFTIIVGTRFSVLIKLIIRNGISLRPVYLARLMVLLMNSLISSTLILAEKKNFGKKTRETEIRKPPLFIIGHWRTGSTLLHQLISLDPQFTTPDMVRTTIPDHLLFSTKYYVPILARVMPDKRPMDNVALTPFSPQEEEFALIRMGSVSPFEKLLFSSDQTYFLKGYDQYIPSGKQLQVWKKNLLTFFKKITLQTGKQIVSKNPCHTMRIELLAEMFPGAKFIHITRDPMIVVPSTIRMWNIVAKENRLKKGWKKPTVSEVTTVLRAYLNHLDKVRQKLNNPITEVRFEALEQEPVKVLKQIYSALDLSWSDRFETAVNQFLSDNRSYKKNSYSLTREEQEMIRSIMKP